MLRPPRHGSWTERLHPRDRMGQFTERGGGWLDQIAAATRRGPYTDTELEQRRNYVNQTVDEHPHLETRVLHRPTRWSDRRAKQQRELVDKIYAAHAHVPNNREAIMSGGLAGAGKTTTLQGHAGIDMNDYMMLSADDMKDAMIHAGMAPTIPGHNLAPMELATLFHVESAYLADMLAERAYADGKNVIIDATMGNRPAPESRIGRLRENGYQVRGVFVDIPLEVSRERVTARYARGMHDWAEGRGNGGRPVPSDFFMGQAGGSGGRTQNRQVFDEFVTDGMFDQWDVYDNSGQSPVPISRGGRRTAPFRLSAADAAADPEVLSGRYEVRDPNGNWIVPRAVTPGAKKNRLSIQVQPISGRNLNPTTHAFMVWDTDELAFRPRPA